MSDPAAPIVFLGPSATREDVAAILPTAILANPIARGDLYRAREQGGNLFLIVDGMFMHQLAVSPREIIDVIRDGAAVYGASSMGALRAAECWPVGMRGVGLIARLYRRGLLQSDDDVAVATDVTRGYAATSVALVNVRYAVSRVKRQAGIGRQAADAIVGAARRLYFPERQWRVILRDAGVDEAMRLEGLLSQFDLKRSDALRAASAVAQAIAAPATVTCRRSSSSGMTLQSRERYPGHDRHGGRDRRELAVQLTKWLFGTGRYQLYIWPLVSAEPELRSLDGRRHEHGTAGARRDALAAILARQLTNVDAIAMELWDELAFVDELDAEWMRWFASDTLASHAHDFDERILRRVREEVAIAHGLSDWDALQEEIVDGYLFEAIPYSWIDEACVRMARARTVVGASTDSGRAPTQPAV